MCGELALEKHVGNTQRSISSLSWRVGDKSIDTFFQESLLISIPYTTDKNRLQIYNLYEFQISIAIALHQVT